MLSSAGVHSVPLSYLHVWAPTEFPHWSEHTQRLNVTQQAFSTHQLVLVLDLPRTSFIHYFIICFSYTVNKKASHHVFPVTSVREEYTSKLFCWHVALQQCATSSGNNGNSAKCLWAELCSVWRFTCCWLMSVSDWKDKLTFTCSCSNQ